MRRHDPLALGERVDVDGGPEGHALAQAFNEMLDRLETERRESTRRALMVQEGERQRVARELHDEVGQTLTGVMLQVEGLAAKIPEELREQLDELRETARSGAEDVRRIVRRLRPEALEDLGLPSALAALATAFHEQAGVRRRTQAGAGPAAVRRAGAGLLPRRAGGVHEHRAACRRFARRAPAQACRRADALLIVRDDGTGLTRRRQRFLARHPRHARARDADRRAAHDRLGRRTAEPRCGCVLPTRRAADDDDAAQDPAS